MSDLADLFQKKIRCETRDEFLGKHFAECKDCQKQLAFVLQEFPLLSVIIGREKVQALIQFTKDHMNGEKQNVNVQAKQK